MKSRFLLVILVLALLPLAFAFAQDEEEEEALGSFADLELTDEEVEAAIEALGEDGFIGIVACTYSTDYHFKVADSARARAEELGIRAEIFDSQINVERQISGIESFVANGVSVLIVCLFDPPSVQDALQAAADAGVQIVQYAGRQMADLGGVTISIEDADLGFAAGGNSPPPLNQTIGGGTKVANLGHPPWLNIRRSMSSSASTMRALTARFRRWRTSDAMMPSSSALMLNRRRWNTSLKAACIAARSIPRPR